MRLSLTTIAFALLGSTLGVPFQSSSIPASGSASISCSGTFSVEPTYSSSSDVPLPNPFAPSSTSLPKSTGTPTSTPVYAGGPVEWTPMKRAGLPIPTGFSSLAAEAESAFGSFSSFAPFKRGGIPIPTGFSSLAAEAESALGSVASFAPRKRTLIRRSYATPTEPCIPTSVPIATPTGVPSGLPASSSLPIPFPTGFGLSGFLM